MKSPVIETPEQLVATLQHNSTLTVPSPDAATRRHWRQLIYATINGGCIPEDRALRHSGRDKGDLVIRLIDKGKSATETGRREGRSVTITVPDRLTKPHPAVVALRSSKELEVPAQLLPRTLRIIQAICEEANRRGYDVRANETPKAWPAEVVILGHKYPFVIREIIKRTRHEPNDEEQRPALLEAVGRSSDWQA